MNNISVGHVITTEVTEATEGCSLRSDVVPFHWFFKFKFLALSLIWVHVGVDSSWAEADDVNGIFEFVSERFSHVSGENFGRRVHSQCWELSVSTDRANKDNS